MGFWSNSTIKFPINNAIAPTGNQNVMLPSRPKNRDADIAHTGSNAYNIAALTGETCFWKIFRTNNATKLPRIAQSIKGNSLPGSSDESYGVSITQDINARNGVTSMRLSYRYRGEADLSIFNTPRAKIDSQSTMDLLVRYTPNSDDWYAGVFVKNLRDQQHINALRENSNVGGGALLGAFTDPRIYGIEFGAKF